MTVAEITHAIREFRDARDWRQFHTPKDMAMAISIEASELLEQFLWRSPAECEARVAEQRDKIGDELADIGIYLFELADLLGYDLLHEMSRKLGQNAAKYPVHKARGSNTKYDELS
jgi:NTP pyrophosphatase (non-canonical NTP hydrolase)